MSDRTAQVMEIRDLLARYCHHVDRGPYEAIVRLFVPDGRLELGTKVLEGRDAVSAFYRDRRSKRIVSRHVVTNVLVDWVSDDEARVTSTVTLFRELGGPVPVFVGDYHDRVVREDGRWWFAVRKLEPVFTTEAQSEAPRLGGEEEP